MFTLTSSEFTEFVASCFSFVSVIVPVFVSVLLVGWVFGFVVTWIKRASYF